MGDRQKNGSIIACPMQGYGRKLSRTFYRREADQVAIDLIGRILVHRVGGKIFRGRIVETEAYVGEHDLACHAAKGRTGRTEVMFGPPGFAYVYFIYGMHTMLNIVTGAKGVAQAVLVRAAEPLDGWDANLSGPGRLATQFHITRADNGLDLTGDRMFLLQGAEQRPVIAVSRRIGVDYAREWRDAPLRFYDATSKAVSKLRNVKHDE